MDEFYEAYIDWKREGRPTFRIMRYETAFRHVGHDDVPEEVAPAMVLYVDDAVRMARMIIERWEMANRCGWCGEKATDRTVDRHGDAYPWCASHEAEVRSLIEEGDF